MGLNRSILSFSFNFSIYFCDFLLVLDYFVNNLVESLYRAMLSLMFHVKYLIVDYFK